MARQVLHGRCIVVTRAPHQAGELVTLLAAQGAESVLYPCIDVQPPQDTTQLDAALRSPGQYHWLVLTSSNTVIALVRRMTALHLDVRWCDVRIAAVGQATAQAAEHYLNVRVDLIPEVQTAAALARTLNLTAGERVLLPQSAIARPVLADALRATGVIVDAITAYETVLGSGGNDLPALLRQGRVDAVTFTSPSTVMNCVQRLGDVSAIAAVPAACIGPVTADAACAAQFRQIIAPEADYSLAGLVAALGHYFSDTVEHNTY